MLKRETNKTITSYIKSVLLLITLLLVGCGDCDENMLVSLNEFENSLMPIENERSLSFENEKIEIISAEVSKVFFNMNDVGLDEGCGNFLAESQFYTMTIQNLTFNISLSKTRSDRTEFSIRINESIFAPECGNPLLDIETYLTNFESDGFLFEDVFVFDFCGLTMNSSQLTGIKTIVYDRNKGINYIKYEDGSFLKLIL